MTQGERRRVPVPLEALINAFETEQPGEIILDLDSGEVFLLSGPDDPDRAEVEAGLGTRFLTVPRSDGVELEGDMRAFAALVADPLLRDALDAAVADGLRAFRAVLLGYPAERGQWLAYRDGQVLARVLTWMAAHGLESSARCDCRHHSETR